MQMEMYMKAIGKMIRVNSIKRRKEEISSDLKII
jgi:hypothetical protein